MSKRTPTCFLGALGAVAWSITILLREQSINNLFLNFVLGIMPNISATWVFICIAEIIYNSKKYKFTNERAIFSSILVFIFALLSEIIHELYLNSPFDNNDIIATIVAILIYLIVFYFKKNTVVE